MLFLLNSNKKVALKRLYPHSCREKSFKCHIRMAERRFKGLRTLEGLLIAKHVYV